jgi:phage terminase small subunit
MTSKPPRHLSAESRRFWNAILAEYELEAEALLVLRAACENWDRAQQAREAIAAEGLTLGGKRHPAVDIEKQAYGLFLRSMRQLGLDVVAPGPVGRPPGR